MNNGNVLIIIEDGIVQSVVAPDGVKVFVLDVDEFAHGGELSCGLQHTDNIKSILKEYKARISERKKDDADYDASDDMQVLADLKEKFKR